MMDARRAELVIRHSRARALVDSLTRSAVMARTLLSQAELDLARFDAAGEVTRMDEPATEAGQVAAEQDQAAEASQDDGGQSETDAILSDPETMQAIAEGSEDAPAYGAF